jgi:CheY-like chemotaxis protein
VSRVVAATLKDGLEAWRTRSLADLDVIHVYLDGFALRVRNAVKVVSVPVLGVVGVLPDGRKHLLALELCAGESFAAWRGCLDTSSRAERRNRLVQSAVSTPSLGGAESSAGWFDVDRPHQVDLPKQFSRTDRSKRQCRCFRRGDVRDMTDAPRPRRPTRVLIVDDDASFRRALKRLLMTMGFTVLTAANGPAALRLVHLNDPDVVCLDLQMPEMSGSDVLGALHLSHPELPVIVVTGADLITEPAKLRRKGPSTC